MTPIQDLIEVLKTHRDTARKKEREYKDLVITEYYDGKAEAFSEAIDFALQMFEKEEEVMSVSKRFSSAEKMAEWLHNNYEEIALNNGWKTQEDCQVPFCDLPKENKQTMIELCKRLLNFC